MSVLKQKTISKPLLFKGIGLHSGKKVTMRLIPSAPNTGIIFKRSDLKKNNIIYPSVHNVSGASFCTRIENETGASVSTIEHLMAALYGKGIDNLLIDLNSHELPIMDGSAKNFVDEINKCGLNISDQPIRILKIEKKVELKNGEKSIIFEPDKISLKINFEINFNNSLISKQTNQVNIYMDNLEQLYNSRTFCLYEDIEKLKSMNLAQGGSLDNAIVVKGDQILNEEKLRNSK